MTRLELSALRKVEEEANSKGKIKRGNVPLTQTNALHWLFAK